MNNTLYLLNTTKRINPAKPETAEFYAADQIGYVLDMAQSGLHKDFRYATSFGTLAGLPVGTCVRVVADQSRRTLSYSAKIIGIHNHATGALEGQVPTKTVPHYVFK